MRKGDLMFNRFKTSLFSPSFIYKFAHDKVFKLIVYYGILILLSTLPQMIRVIYLDNLTANSRSDIRNLIVNSENFPECTISDYALQDCANNQFFYDEFTLLFLPDDVPSTFGKVYVVFYEEHVSIVTSGQAVETFTYRDLQLESLNFPLLNEGDYDELEALFIGVERFMALTKLYWAPALIIYHIGYSMFYFSLIILAVALIYTNRVLRVRFAIRLRLATYASTPFFVGLLIADLYGIPELVFLFLIFPYIFMNKAVIGYIQSQLKNKPEETHL